ncbi:MAG TPA: hypothetical protein VFV50_13100 [Bdellovibrionales bacterium]|nr:hypothetical protein [Bdellovibrionales bacterium]
MFGRLLLFALLVAFFVSCKAKAEEPVPAEPQPTQADAVKPLNDLLPDLNAGEAKPTKCETYCKFDPHQKNHVH